MIDIIVDEEFRTALPEPRFEEIAELERQIRRDCAPRDALIVWPTGRGLVLIDGHHRLAICRRHGLPFRVEERHFESRDDVLAEIVNTQLARRNLTDSWSKYLLGRDYDAGKRQGARTDLTSGNSCQKSTAERIAGERRVGERTVRSAADYARAIDRIANANPAAKMAILSEKVDLTKNDVIELADHPAVIEEAFSRTEVTRGLVRQLLQNRRRCEKFGALIQQGTPGPDENWGRFSVILADPPWSYHDENPFTAASNSFSTLGLEEIVKIWKVDLEMQKYLTPDAVLFLWATAPNRPTAHQFIEATGFGYKTELIWLKPRTVFGAYSHCAHENLLIATRGSLTPVKKVRSAFEGQPWARLHSAKPDVAYEIIEQMYPELLKLELFARRYRAGWKSWGNELGRYEQPGPTRKERTQHELGRDEGHVRQKGNVREVELTGHNGVTIQSASLRHSVSITSAPLISRPSFSRIFKRAAHYVLRKHSARELASTLSGTASYRFINSPGRQLLLAASVPPQYDAVWFPGACYRKSLDHPYLARALVVDQLRLAVRGDLGIIDVFACSGHDEGD